MKLLAAYNYSPNFFGRSGAGNYVEGGVDVTLPFEVTASGRVGYQWIQNNPRFGTPDYLWYSVGVSREIYAGFTGTLAWYGTNIDKKECVPGRRPRRRRPAHLRGPRALHPQQDLLIQRIGGAGQGAGRRAGAFFVLGAAAPAFRCRPQGLLAFSGLCGLVLPLHPSRTSAAPMPATRASVTSTPLAGVRRFASPAVKAAIRRRLFEFLGLACGLAGLALLVALASYDPADPSLNTATTRRAANLVGPAGAMLADLLLQGFGWAGALPGVALLAWAWRLATHRGLGLFPARARGAAGRPAGRRRGADPGAAAGQPADRRPGPAAPAAASPPARCTTPRRPCSAPSAGWSPPPRWWLAAVLLGIAALGLSPSEWLGLGRARGRGRSASPAPAAPGARRRRHPRPARRPGPPPVPLPVAAAAVNPGADLVRRARAQRMPRPSGAAGRAASRASAPPPERPAHARSAAAPRPPAKPRIGPARPAGQAGQAGRGRSCCRSARTPGGCRRCRCCKPPRPARGTGPSEEALQANARLLETVLADYGVQGEIVEDPSRPGGDAVRAGAGAGHQGVPRHRPGRRRRPQPCSAPRCASPPCPAAT